ncbi:MAG: endonuclease III domain-containing protein [Candidatus Ranarchaeia archaeon]
MQNDEVRVRCLLKKLMAHFASRIDPWWPYEKPLDIIVGAFLTQNTTWKTVEKAIATLKQKKLLSISILSNKRYLSSLRRCIRPTGYYNQKSLFLHEFFRYLADKFKGDLTLFLSQDLSLLRQQLLDRKGIGPETADTILLYAAKYPRFVIDAYTIRILRRFKIDTPLQYTALQALFERSISPDVSYYQRAHAALVEHAKTYCTKRNPLCSDCPVFLECRYTTSPMVNNKKDSNK